MLLSDIRPRRLGIALTPLVDVVFILLLFFMLTSSFQRLKQVPVDATAATPDARAETGETFTAAPARLQVLVVDGETLRIEGSLYRTRGRSLETLLLGVKAEGRAVAVGGLRGASIQDLVSTLDRLRSIGLTDVGLFESVSEP